MLKPSSPLYGGKRGGGRLCVHAIRYSRNWRRGVDLPSKIFFADRYPELLETVDFSRSEKHIVEQLGVDDRTTTIWWICSDYGHSYPRTVSSRLSNLNKKIGACLYCQNALLLEGFNDLASTHPEIAAQWDYEKNAPQTPSDVMAHDTTPVFWICAEGHSSHTHPQARALQGKICGVCLNKVVQVGINDLFTTNPELREMWDFAANKDLDPSKLTKQSKKTAHWVCRNGHSFESSVKARAVLGSGCKFCVNREVSPGFNDLKSLHPAIAAEFDSELNKTEPHLVLAGTAEYFYWKCPEGHSWRAKVSNRVSRQSGCPGCSLGGFDQSKSGLFYIIANSRLGAMKVGITNPESKSDRVKGWVDAGWTVLFTYEADGLTIQSLELQMKRWIKYDLGLPSYLSKQDVGIMRGASETFSADAVSESDLIAKVESTIDLVTRKPR